MEQTSLRSESFITITSSFKDWLYVLGYSEKSVYELPHCIKEMLHFQENRGLYKIDHLNGNRLLNYYEYLKKRPNKKNGHRLNNNTLNKHLQALHKFNDYLLQTGKIENAMPYISNEDKEESYTNVLSINDIKCLYEASYHLNNNQKTYLLGARDRAMLSVFYGCGLRRNEGYHLNINDIHFDKKLLHVKKGKNFSERLVPFNNANAKFLQEYLNDARPILCTNVSEKAFFISHRSNRMKGESLLIRLKSLIKLSGNKQLEEMDIGLHTLRHSIATHLMDGGMNIKNIAKFLGHRSLEATQIYTHLSMESNGTIQAISRFDKIE